MKRASKSPRKLTWTVAILLLVLAGIITILELTNTTYIFHKKSTPHTASEYTKGTSDGDDASKPHSNDTAGDSKDSAGDSKDLVEPTGNFVSSHHATSTSNLSSTCNSTPGATCKITFSKEGVTKALQTKTLDDGGAAYWSWQPGDIDLSPGVWSVKATVRLGDKSESTTDALSLEIR